MSAVRYLLDANVFIEAKQRYYAFAICPGFWEALVWHHVEGSVWSIDRVKDELAHYGDELSDWIEDEVPDAAFCSTNTSAVAALYGDVIKWASAEQQYTPGAKAEFAKARVADAWLVAYAAAMGMTLVTHETYDDQIRRRVKIPNACQQFGVPYVNTFDMLSVLACKFAWTCP
jgi:hypothetical protein